MARQKELADDLTAKDAARTLFVWRSQPALIVTRTDAHLPSFAQAAQDLDARGWPVLLRKSGGGACPVGPGTLQIALILPAFGGATLETMYAALVRLIQSTLRQFGVVAGTGHVPGAFCPGRYDVIANGKKIAGLAQHWGHNGSGAYCITAAASLIVDDDPGVLCGAVNRFYGIAGGATLYQPGAITSLRVCVDERARIDYCLAREVGDRLARLGPEILRDLGT
jgi:hypothetical protein